MPKELLEVRSFHAGTITTPSERDIPDDAASYSLNIDPVAEDGVLRGVSTDGHLTTQAYQNVGTGTPVVCAADTLAWIVSAGKRDLVFHDSETDSIKYIADIYAAAGQTLASFPPTSMSGRASLQSNNKEVHIGAGSGGNDFPLWAGYPAFGQFGGVTPTSMILESAKLDPPSEFVVLNKVVMHADATTLFGFQRGGTYIYKFRIENHKRKFLARSTFNFTKIAAIAKGDKDGENVLYVLDDIYDAGDFTYPYVLYELDMASFKVRQQWNVRDQTDVQSNSVPDTNSTTGAQTNGWFSGQPESNTSHDGECYDMIHVYAGNGSKNFLFFKNRVGDCLNPMFARAPFPVLGEPCDLTYWTPSLGQGITAIRLDTSDESGVNPTVIFSASAKTISVTVESGTFAWGTGAASMSNLDGTDMYGHGFPKAQGHAGFLKITGTVDNNDVYKIDRIVGHQIFIDDSDSNHPSLTDETVDTDIGGINVTFEHQPFNDDDVGNTTGAFTVYNDSNEYVPIVDNSLLPSGRCKNANVLDSSNNRYEFFNSLFKPKGVTNSSAHAWCGFAFQIHFDCAGANSNNITNGDVWYQYSKYQGNALRRMVHNHSAFQTGEPYASGEWSKENHNGGSYMAMIMRDDYEHFGILNSEGNGDIDESGQGALVFLSEINETDTFTGDGYGFSQALLANASGTFYADPADTTWQGSNAYRRHGLQGFLTGGTSNNETGLITMCDTDSTGTTENSHGPSNLFSNINSFTLPDVTSDSNGDVASKHAIETGSGNTALDVFQPVGVPHATSSGLTVEIFNGSILDSFGHSEGWCYGLLNSITVSTEKICDIEPVTYESSSSSILDQAKSQYYKASFLYDGYQESPLSAVLVAGSASADNKKGVLEIHLRPSGVNSRVTHLNIYVAEGTTSSGADTLYRLLESVPLDGRWGKNDTTADYYTGLPGWGDFYKHIIYDKGFYGATYDALTGISQEVVETLPNYQLSCQQNNHLYIAGCWHLHFEDAENFMFKSKAFNFDQFDWTRDLLRLPVKPTALAAFQGRVYAFDENNIYRIEPNQFFIEDIFTGAGCSSQDSVCVTEFGMCFANKNNVYLHDGTTPKLIANPILRDAAGETGYSYQMLAKLAAPKILFDSKRSSFIILLKFSGSHYYCWSFNLIKQRWDLFYFATTAPRGIISGKDGELLVSTGTTSSAVLLNYLGGSTTDSWDWTSKKFTMGGDTQDKSFKKFKVSGENLGTLGTNINIKVDGNNVTETGDIDDFRTSVKKGKSVQWILSNQASDASVDTLGMVYRARPIK